MVVVEVFEHTLNDGGSCSGIERFGEDVGKVALATHMRNTANLHSTAFVNPMKADGQMFLLQASFHTGDRVNN